MTVEIREDICWRRVTSKFLPRSGEWASPSELALKVAPNLRRIAVVVLTTSKQEEDIVRSYDLGVNSCISKPVDMDQFVRVVRSLREYWFRVVLLVPKVRRSRLSSGADRNLPVVYEERCEIVCI